MAVVRPINKKKIQKGIRMRIGITYTASTSIFSGGRGQTAINLATALSEHDVEFINIGITQANNLMWWLDAPELPNKKINILDCSENSYDILFDIDGFLESNIRRKIANKIIVFYRKTFVINEIENAVYNQAPLPLNLIGCDAVWMWNELNCNEEAFLRETLPVQLYLVPYMWSSRFIEYYRGNNPQNLLQNNSPIVLHIIDKNYDNQSNSVPMIVATSLALNKYQELKNNISILIENGEDISNNGFFRNNIWNNVIVNNESFYSIKGRSRISDWLVDSSACNHLAVSYTRFTAFSHFMLDLAYLNIPHIHNSPFLSNIHPDLAQYYYKETDISEAIERIATAAFSNTILNQRNIGQIRESLLKFSPENLSGQYHSLLSEFMKVAGNIRADSHQQQQQQLQSQPDSNLAYQTNLEHFPVPPYKVLFVDFWVNFEPDNNFFTDMFKYYNINIIALGPDSIEEPDLIICGPFIEHSGKNRTNWNSDIPRVYFTGESQQFYQTPYDDDTIKLFLTFSLREDERAIRLPLWVLYLDWFNRLAESSFTERRFEQYDRNPGIFPIKYVKDPHPIPSKDRDEFCSFVVTNPYSNIRNLFFKKASEYKKINSGGHLYNNIGGPLVSEGGGGAKGDGVKLQFLEKHRYNICFENTDEDGYVTEKLLHAKLAGCVPLYWGDKNAKIDFNSESFVNLSGMTLQQMIRTLKSIDENEQERDRISQCPPLSSQDIEKWYLTFSKIVDKCKRLMDVRLTKKKSGPILVSYLDSSTAKKYYKGFKININFLEQIKKSIYSNLRYIIYYSKNTDIKNYCSFIDKKIDLGFVEFRELDLNLLCDKYNIIGDKDDYTKYKNYGWRLLLANKLVSEKGNEFLNKTIILCNPGITWLNMPDFLVNGVQELEQGCIFFRDPNVNISNYSSQEIIKKLSIIKEDLESNSVFSEILCFKNNNIQAVRFFKECLEIDNKHEIILNTYKLEINMNNEIVTNSHDSILYSLLLKKYKMPNIDITDIINKTSLYSTFNNNNYIYYHDGNFLEINRLLPNIDNIVIINLERRPDRLEELYKSFTLLINFSTVFKAIDGLKLELTPGLKQLFRNNDFKWKKSVMGCALSHMEVWNKLLNEKNPDINNYLILEDDVRFKESMMETLSKSLNNLPSENWDVLYLGGVLPCNMGMYKNVLEHVKGNWYRIRPNDLFSPGYELPVFHHCLYSYVLSKRGAIKLRKAIEEKGIWTSIDHLVMSVLSGLELYVLGDSATYSYQESEQDYRDTDYDNFNRLVKYDSDLWNNNEHF